MFLAKPAARARSRCTAAAEHGCMAEINSGVAEARVRAGFCYLYKSCPRAKPRSAGAVPEPWEYTLKEARQPGHGTGRSGRQKSPLCICLCLLFVKASLLEHFGDSNSEISSPSVSFPRRSERILSHYLLPAAPTASSHPQTCRRRSNVPSIQAHLRQRCDTSLIF